jgi:hypothetical protein
MELVFGWSSSVSKATDYKPDESGSIPGRGIIFVFVATL